MTTRKPNVFLLGAPKCGTTNLVRALEQHSKVFLPYPKETGFWATDLVRDKGVSNIQTLEDYLALFAVAPAGKTHLIDGSVVHLYSEAAVPNILEFNPDARFIIMLRNPVEQVQSWHQEQVFNLNEDERDFWAAWSLQEQREKGERLPATVGEPGRIIYGKYCSLGDQLERAMAHIPEGRLLVGFIDDIRADAPGFYRSVSDFLGLEDEDLSDIGVVKASHQHRFQGLARFYQSPPPAIAPAVRGLKKWLRTGNGGTLKAVKGMLTKDLKRARLSPEQLAELHRVFDPQTDKIERLTGRDLSHWKAGVAA
ncbi:sulfotransferase family protein [Chachezhania sediminis]|uniref:sulfotransferase family protein n=1 Tax=Chachezhania sediminis TaxID=2599291 RepID=UPI00131DA049|nr:sulfotransferase [Chachezhania sediminis]